MTFTVSANYTNQTLWKDWFLSRDSDRHLKLMKGQTTYLSPEGEPLAVLQVNWGLVDPNQGESLLAESQILDASMQMNNFQKQFSSLGWSMPIHCLP
jgi:hypothetical protein